MISLEGSEFSCSIKVYG